MDADETIKISVRHLNFYYAGGHQALFDNSIDIPANRITAVIGPSGCGKSTHLRVYNRIFELYRGQRAEGEVRIDGKNILDRDIDVLELRRKVGMIFQKPTPFPMSVFDNVAYPMRLHFKLSKREIADRVEQALRGASLWDEVKDKLKKIRARAFRRSAAAALHRACDCRRTGDSAHGRADQRGRSCRHAEDRGSCAAAA